ncbi:MAG TPA: DUF927 domain-containing protein, partial [Armatimonadota bacterium]|nr:DUF927 domain-containing protein [Armatimonadota bacterium]
MSSRQLIAVALFGNKTDRRPEQKLLTWPRLAAQLAEHQERSEKDGPLFSPTLYKKGHGRGAAGVQAVSCLVLDFDDGIGPDEITPAWDGWEYLTYSTFNHAENHPKWRAVFPLKEAVIASEWPRVYRNLTAVLGQGHADPSCKDASRLYYLPSCRPEMERFAARHAGEWLDAGAFPDVAPLTDEGKSAPAEPAAPIRRDGRRVAPETLIERALGRIQQEGGRNLAGFWLACQLRDNGYPPDEAAALLGDYQARVPDGPEPYTLDEALHSVDEAYKSAPREPWEQPRPFPLKGSSGTPAGDDTLHAAWDAVAELKADPGAVFEPSVLDALAAIRRWDPANWQRLVAAMKPHVKLRDLEQALQERAPTAEEPQGRPRLAGDMLDDCPAPQLVIPGPYVLKPDATGRIAETEHGAGIATLAPGPIIITGRARDTLSGQESLLLAWKREHHWERRVVERKQAITSRGLADLVDFGLPYIEEHGKQIATYLSRLEATNLGTLPCAKVTSHLGWQGNPEDAPFLCGNSLVLPGGEIERAAALDPERPERWAPDRVMFHGVGEGEQQIVAAFHAAGTRAGWEETLLKLVPYPRVMAVFYAAFCPPLLQILGVPNFIVDISHATTTGKTTSLRAAGSIYGNPYENAENTVVGTWDNSRTWLERSAHVVNDLVLILDDTKRARRAEDVAAGLYSVAQGRGRGRGTIRGIARSAHFHTVLLSSGEQPATSFTQDGGTRARV